MGACLSTPGAGLAAGRAAKPSPERSAVAASSTADEAQAPAAFTPPASTTSWSSPPDDGPGPSGRVDAVACVGPATGAGGRGPRPPPDEAERLEYLCALQVLDSPKDPRFDDITKLLCTIFDVPIAIVSLVDRERQWFKSAQGLGDVTETDRRDSFCAWTLLPPHPEMLVVPDATKDVRFRANPLVTGAPGIRFYAGAPLVGASGARLGSLCVIDTRPRTVDAAQCAVLANFAEVVMRELEKEKARAVEAARLRSRAVDLLRVMDAFTDCVLLVDVGNGRGGKGTDAGGAPSAHPPAGGGCVQGAAAAAGAHPGGPHWKVLFANAAAAKAAAIDPAADAGRDFWELFEMADGAAGHTHGSAHGRASIAEFGVAPCAGAVPPVLLPKTRSRETFSVDVIRCPPSDVTPSSPGAGCAARFRATLRPAAGAGLDGAPAIAIPNVGTTWGGSGSDAADGMYFVTLTYLGAAMEHASPTLGRASSVPLPQLNGAVPQQDGVAERLAARSPTAAIPPSLVSKTTPIAGPEGSPPSGPHPPPPPAWDPLADVEVGLLIGQGAYGRVYRGMWAGSPVAVKVIPHVGPAGGPGPAGVRGALEALHAVDLAHPHIVQTYKSAQRTLVPRVSASSGEGSSATTVGGGAGSSNGAAALATGGGGGPATMPALGGGPAGAPVAPASEGTDALLAAVAAPTTAVLASGGGGGGPPSTTALRVPARVLTETWLVMEYCDQGNLQFAVDRGAFSLDDGGGGAAAAAEGDPPPPPPQPNMPAIVATAREVAAAMAYLHAQGILHGDLTGANVLLATAPAGTAPTDARGFVAKVGDFGFARVLAGGADASVSTGTYGTVTHCPPELLTAGRLSKAADVYAFGVLLWECYTGRRPWEGMMQMQIIFHVTVRKRRLAFPPGAAESHPRFVALAEACMAPGAGDRPSFDGVLEQLLGVEGA